MAHYINDFTKDLPNFSKAICLRLDELVHEAVPEFEEGKKWEFCGYWTDKGIICGFYAAKEFVTLNFYEGALLRDDKHLFNYGDMNARGRSVKFSDISEVNKRKEDIIAYLQEAFENNKKGLKAKVSDRILEIPEELKKVLKKAGLLEKFEKMAYTHRKEYIVWIQDAKKEETRQRRLEKALVMISKGEAVS